MDKIQIIKVGDFLPSGYFELHSIFNNVANFFNKKDELISFLLKESYMNPTSVLIKGIKLSDIKKVSVNKSIIKFSEKQFLIKNIDQFNSSLNYDLINWNDLEKVITNFENQFLDKLNKKSLSFLLKPEHEQFFKSNFELAYVRHIKSAVTKIINGHTLDSITMLKGAGFGLTPSGDDFITGILYAIDIAQKKLNYKKTNISSSIANTAKGKNLISNSQILLASKGAYFYRFKNFIHSLFKNEDKIYINFNSLLSIGETSGSDILTGFIFGLKNIFKFISI